MKNKLFSTFVAFTLCITSNVMTSYGTDKQSADIKGIIKYIDHIMIISEDAEKLKYFLSNVFQLPEAWPYKQFYDFNSGGVFAGNVYIESTDNKKYMTEARISGFAFEPEGTTEQIMAEMNRRNIPNNLQEKHDAYTTINITNILPGSWIFFCEYSINKGKRKAQKERQQLKLKEQNGGPLGIEYVSEIRLMIDNENRIKDFRDLLAPIKEKKNYLFEFGAGPSLRFIKSDKNCIYAIRFHVKSIDKVRNYLVNNKIIGNEDDVVVATNPNKTYGVLFEFSEI